MTERLEVGDCKELVRRLFPRTVHAVISDPPYELTQGSKTSPARILAEFLFPDNAKIKADLSRQCDLAALIAEIASLHRVGDLTGPAPAVPITAVALNQNAASGHKEIKDGDKAPGAVADCDRGLHVGANGPQYLGAFALKCADFGAILNAINGAGCGFYAGGIGIGLGVSAPRGGATQSGFATLCGRLDGALSVDQPVGSAPIGIGASVATEDPAVARFAVTGGTVTRCAAPVALVFLTALHRGGASAIRASAGASALPPVLEPDRTRLVVDAANGTLAIDFVCHSMSLSEKGFMGKAWDGSKIAHDVALWRDVLAVLKPGGHVAAFGATRTQHRLAVAIEDAGFEIRDAVAWLYGQGFPKSLNVSKELDRVAGKRGEQTGTLASPAGNVAGAGVSLFTEGFGAPAVPVFAPATQEAEQWQGFGTALKPSYEPVVIGRAPLDGTVAANVLKHGTGGLNVDECRIGTASGRVAGKSTGVFRDGLNGGGSMPLNAGRWPANVACDEYAAALIDEQSGRTVSRSSPLDGQGRRPGGFGDIGAAKGDPCRNGPAYDDEGGASRFFYCAKASTAEREAGLDDLPVQSAGELTGGRAEGSAGLQSPRAGAGRTSESGRRNVHATVKPIALMRWLVRLLTRPGDTVLDPFMGSGTTGIACVLEGRNFIGFELDPVHFEIAQRRIAAARAGFFDADESGKTVVRKPAPVSRQASLFDL